MSTMKPFKKQHSEVFVIWYKTANKVKLSQNYSALYSFYQMGIIIYSITFYLD